MNSTPNLFISTPRIESQVVTATSLREGTGGTLFPLFIANSSNGSRVESVYFTNAGPIGTGVSANAIRLYLTDSAGNNPKLIREFTYVSYAPTTVINAPYMTFNFPGGMYLGTNSALYVGQSTYFNSRDTAHWVATGGDC